MAPIIKGSLKIIKTNLWKTNGHENTGLVVDGNPIATSFVYKFTKTKEMRRKRDENTTSP